MVAIAVPSAIVAEGSSPLDSPMSHESPMIRVLIKMTRTQVRRLLEVISE